MSDTKKQIYYDGDVGIGTSNPNQRLDVLGKIKIGNDTEIPSAGVIRFAGGKFEGFDGSAWKPFFTEAQNKLHIVDEDIRLQKKHLGNNASSWSQNILFADEADRVGAKIIGKREKWDGAPMGLSFHTGGLNETGERLTIKSNGHVGIGATDPKEKLDVDGNIKGGITKLFYLKNGRNGDPSLVSKNTSMLRIGANGAIGFWANAKTEENDLAQMILDKTGHMGIGNISPQKPLDIGAAGGIRISQTAAESDQNEILFQDNGQIRSSDNNHRIIFDRSNDKLELREYGDIIFSPGATNSQRTGKVIINKDGQVSIGVAATHENFKVQAKGGNGSWKGGVAAGGDSNAVVIGELNGAAVIGGHSSALDAWANLLINPNSHNVGIGNTNPEAKLHLVYENQDANGNTFIIGPTTQANLRLGYDQEYSWIQSHGGKPLSINPIGNFIGIGTTAPKHLLDIAGKIKIGNDETAPSPGAIRFVENRFEGFDGSTWRSFTEAGGNPQIGNNLVVGHPWDGAVTVTGVNIGKPDGNGGWGAGSAFMQMKDTNQSEGVNAGTGISFYAHTWGGGTNEVMRIAANGNIGIGDTAPNQKLTIKGGGIGFDHNSIDKKLYCPVDGVLEWMTNAAAGERAFAVSHQGEKRVYLSVNGNSYFTGGYVGIGHSGPLARLHLIHENQNADGNAFIIGPTDQANLRLGYNQEYSWIQSHGGKPLSINPIGNRLGVGTDKPHPNVKMQVKGGEGPWKGGIAAGGDTAAVVMGELDGAAVIGGHSGALNAWNTLLINLDGSYVGIGTTNPKYTLDVNGQIRGEVVSPSDTRLKKNIHTVGNALEKIISLRGVNYQWKDDKKGNSSQMGLVAQEVEDIFPETVATDSEGYKSVAYAKMVAPIIEAIKELKAEKDREVASLRVALEEKEAVIAELLRKK